MIENVVIGKPIISPKEIFSLNEKDWMSIEQPKTVFTEERYLPRILAQYGIMKSASEVRRNRKDLDIELTTSDFLSIKIGKKFLFILVGE